MSFFVYICRMVSLDKEYNQIEWYEYILTTFDTNRIELRQDKLKILGF